MSRASACIIATGAGVLVVSFAAWRLRSRRSHVHERGLAGAQAEEHARKVLQALQGIHQTRKSVGVNDKSADLLTSAAVRRRAALLIQRHWRARYSGASFMSLQTTLKKEHNSTFDACRMSDEKLAAWMREETLRKEMLRLFYNAEAYKHRLAEQANNPVSLGTRIIHELSKRRPMPAARGANGPASGALTLSNPYAGVDFTVDQSQDPRWWKIGFHQHGPNGEEQFGFFPYTKVVKLLHEKGYRCAVIVEHENFVEFTPQESEQLTAAVSPGGSCEGLVLFTGAEGRSHSAWGEHVTFVSNHPELLIATHPNTVQADGMDQVDHSHFLEDSSFENVNFLEIFNGWGRHFKPAQFWLATEKWDKILSMGCRVNAVADDDSMLDFPGIASSVCCRPELRGKGLPNQFSGCGLGWNMVFVGSETAGASSRETVGIGIGAAGDLVAACAEPRRRVIRALNKGNYYCTTGVTILDIHVEGPTITVKTADAERMLGSIDHGEIIARADGTSITFTVPARATYARVTCSKGEGEHHLYGEQFAWTQPFWVSIGGVPRSVDPRHHHPNGKKVSGWSRLRQFGLDRLRRELYREEAEANVRARASETDEQKRESADNETAIAEYYNKQLPTYLKVWGEDGRISWGYFASPSMSFKDAQTQQVERLASAGRLDTSSIVLDLGCGTAVNSIYLAKRYGCRVLGLDISVAVLRKARSMLACTDAALHDRVSLYEGTLEDLMHDIAAGSDTVVPLQHILQAAADRARPFTHLWSTCTNWFIPNESRSQIFSNFAKISMPGSVLVMDDCLCPNIDISASSRAAVYDRLNLGRLWTQTEYRHRIEDAGFDIEVFDDISDHCRKSYECLAANAKEHGEAELAQQYLGTVDAIKKSDLAWYAIVATGRAPKKHQLKHSLTETGVAKADGWFAAEEREIERLETLLASKRAALADAKLRVRAWDGEASLLLAFGWYSLFYLYGTPQLKNFGL